jgi:predicted acetylornithine/succinylornithine family transaminase
MSQPVLVDARMETYARWPVEFVSGRGSTLYDGDGRSYLDLVAGIAVASIGHSHPALVGAISSQAARLIHVSNLYETLPQRELASQLSGLTGGMSSFFCNSGAESVECAIKLARKWGGPHRSRLVCAVSGFHGRTMGALSATGQPAKAAPFEPLVPGFSHVPFDDLVALEAELDGHVAAVILEPIQGEAGVVVPSPDYLSEVRALCDAAGVLLILDEVQTGVARTGAWFAYEHSHISPDVVCVAKGLAGGLPIGACLARPEVAASFSAGDHGSTFGGGPVQARAALAVIDVIEREELLERATDAGARLRSGLEEVFGVGTARGAGLLLAVILPGPLAKDLTARALDKGLLINNPAADVVRFTPPLVITDHEIDRALDILKEAWDEIRQT